MDEDLLVLPGTNSLILIVQPDHTIDAYEGRRYDLTTGALLTTYPLGAGVDNGSQARLMLDLGLLTSFWVRTFPTEDGSTSTNWHFDIASGATIAPTPYPRCRPIPRTPPRCRCRVPVLRGVASAVPPACAVGIPSPPPTNKPACAPGNISDGQA